MSPELRQRIESRPTWTFTECLALAAEFGVKTRLVVAMVMMCGREYVDTGPAAPAPRPPESAT